MALEIGNGADVIAGSVVGCEEYEPVPGPTGVPFSEALLGIVNGNGDDLLDPDSEPVAGRGETEPVKVPAVAVTENDV